MGLMERLEKYKIEKPGEADSQNQKTVFLDNFGTLKEKVHKEIIETLNKDYGEKGKSQTVLSKDDQQELIKNLIQNAIESESSVNRSEKAKLVSELCNEVMGLGPLEPLLAEPTISEIMVNGPYQVYIERMGKLELTDVRFKDEEHVMNIIDRIVSSIGRHIDESSPMVDARLQDGSRVNVIIPPLSLKGPVITIRKFSKIPLTVQDIIRSGSLSPKMAHFLETCVKGKANVLVSGGTGSGKTTLLNILSTYIPDNERIVTIEDAAELQLRQAHVVTLESRPANHEGKGQISIRELVRNALRMRPDRIVVGEVRSGEALDMLQAMNTGHDGSLTTAHANSPRDLLSRIETMVLMAGMELPVRAIREQIASAIDIIVQQSRFRDGTRKIVNITEVTGMEGDIISLQDLFVYENQGIDTGGKVKGRFRATGIRAHCIEKLKSNGATVMDDWFMD
jgi:pilus assembly protein CpaF